MELKRLEQRNAEFGSGGKDKEHVHYRGNKTSTLIQGKRFVLALTLLILPLVALSLSLSSDPVVADLHRLEKFWRKPLEMMNQPQKKPLRFMKSNEERERGLQCRRHAVIECVTNATAWTTPAT